MQQALVNTNLYFDCFTVAVAEDKADPLQINLQIYVE